MHTLKIRGNIAFWSSGREMGEIPSIYHSLMILEVLEETSLPKVGGGQPLRKAGRGMTSTGDRRSLK